MRKIILWLALLLPTFANAQWVNGVIQRDNTSTWIRYLQGTNQVRLALYSDLPTVTPVSFTAFGSTPNVNGASVASNVITLQPASASFPGGVSTGTQTFAGAKTFSATFTSFNNIGASALDMSGNTNGVILSGSSLLRIRNTTNTSDIATFNSSTLDANFYANVNIAGLTANRALYTDGVKTLTSSATTATQLGYLSGASGTTGTSSLVFSNSPSFTTPNIGSATASGILMSGQYIDWSGQTAGRIISSTTTWGLRNSANNADHLSINNSTSAATFAGSIIGSSFVKSGGTGSQYLMADGSVTTGGGGVTTMTTIGGASNANGATITGNTLQLQAATTSFGGVVTTISQNFAGDKTFYGNILTSGTNIRVVGAGSGTAMASPYIGSFDATGADGMFMQRTAFNDMNFYSRTGNVNTLTHQLGYAGDLYIVGATATKASGTAWVNPSDSRLKKNVVNYTKGLSDVKLIVPKEWNFNAASGYDMSKKHVSAVAQDLLAISPSMVSTFTGKLNGVDTELYQVDTNDLPWMLVNSVKELDGKTTAYTGTTNASGTYSITFPIPYATRPNIQVTQINSLDTHTVKVVASTTGFTVTVRNRVDVIGLLPTYQNVNGATVDVLVTKQ